MMDLGKHAAFIWASYAVVAVVLTGLVIALIQAGARLQRRLDELDARGIKRRSQTPE
jgi:heme exporter protein D